MNAVAASKKKNNKKKKNTSSKSKDATGLSNGEALPATEEHGNDDESETVSLMSAYQCHKQRPRRRIGWSR